MSLEDLPVELIENIAEHASALDCKNEHTPKQFEILPTLPSILNLRLVCRVLEASTFRFFSRHHFSNIRASVELEAYKKLIMLSETRLSPAVERIALVTSSLPEEAYFISLWNSLEEVAARSPGLLSWSNQYFRSISFKGPGWHRSTSRPGCMGRIMSSENESAAAGRAWLSEQQYFLTHSLDETMLTEALQNFHNCKAISLRKSDTRLEWCFSDEIRQLKSLCGLTRSCKVNRSDELSVRFQAVVAAIARSKADITSIKVSEDLFMQVAVCQTAFYLTSSEKSLFRDSLSRLRSLDIIITYQQRRFLYEENCLGEFLGLCTGLEELKVKEVCFAYSFMGDICDAIVKGCKSQQYQFPPLKRLQLTNVFVETLEILIEFIKCSSSTLQALDLNKVGVRTYSSARAPWSLKCAKLVGALTGIPNLRSFQLSGEADYARKGVDRSFLFKYISARYSVCVAAMHEYGWTVHYQGGEMDDFLLEMESVFMRIHETVSVAPW